MSAKRNLIIFGALATVGLINASCGATTDGIVTIGDNDAEKASNTMVERAVAISDFTQLDATSAIHIEYTQGPVAAVNVKAPDNVMPYVKIVNKGNTLNMKIDKNFQFNDKNVVVVTLTSPGLSEVDLSSASSFSASSLTANDFDLELTGASSFTVDTLTATRELDLDLEGASTFTVTTMSGAEADCDIAAASTFTVGAFTVNQTTVSATGASTVNIKALSAQQAYLGAGGASTFTVSGQSQSGALSVTGASTFNATGLQGTFTVQNTSGSTMNR